MKGQEFKCPNCSTKEAEVWHPWGTQKRAYRVNGRDLTVEEQTAICPKTGKDARDGIVADGPTSTGLKKRAEVEESPNAAMRAAHPATPAVKTRADVAVSPATPAVKTRADVAVSPEREKRAEAPVAPEGRMRAVREAATGNSTREPEARTPVGQPSGLTAKQRRELPTKS